MARLRESPPVSARRKSPAECESPPRGESAGTSNPPPFDAPTQHEETVSDAPQLSEGGDSNHSWFTARQRPGERVLHHSRGELYVGQVKKARRETRKPTYIAQKEAKRTLLDELWTLERRATQLRRRIGLPTTEDTDSLGHTQSSNRAMQDAIQSQHLRVGGMQSLLSSHVVRGAKPRWMNSHHNPLSTYIHLGTDMAQRRRSLLVMRAAKLAYAHKYVQERLRFFGDEREYEVGEKFVNDKGDDVRSRSQVIHFPGAQSVKQVFDAIVMSGFFAELAITDKLGHLTVREDIDTVGTCMSQHRLLTTFTSGVVQVMNCVSFAEYYDSFEELQGRAYGLVVVDFIDKDELHPYSEKHVRKDLSAVFAVTCLHKQTHACSMSAVGDDEPVVVVRRSAFATYHRPRFQISKTDMEMLRRDTTAWGDMVRECVKDSISLSRTSA